MVASKRTIEGRIARALALAVALERGITDLEELARARSLLISEDPSRSTSRR